MHPGSLGVFLVSVVAFELSSYAATRRTAHLVGIGAATGALVMTKVNAGRPRRDCGRLCLRCRKQADPALDADRRRGAGRSLPDRARVPAHLEAVGRHVRDSRGRDDRRRCSCSCRSISCRCRAGRSSRWHRVLRWRSSVSLAYPLVTGSPLSDVINGVFIRPLTFSDAFAVPATVSLDWPSFVIAMVGVGFAVAFRSFSKESVRQPPAWMHATLAALALWVLGVGVTTYVTGYVTAKWLPDHRRSSGARILQRCRRADPVGVAVDACCWRRCRSSLPTRSPARRWRGPRLRWSSRARLLWPPVSTTAALA